MQKIRQGEILLKVIQEAKAHSLQDSLQLDIQ